MSFKINGNIVIDANGVVIPSFTTGTRPGNAVNGQIIYNLSTNLMEIYDTGLWKDALSNASGGAFLYRQIITTGYVMGGYQSTSPWKNVNKMVHATDVMTNLGDLLSFAGAYTSGFCSTTRGYLWSADNSWPGTSTQTVAFNLATETGAGTNTNWNMSVTRDDNATGFKEQSYAYITAGGNSAIDIFTAATETMSAGANGAGITGDGQQSGGASFSSETAAYYWGNESKKLTFGSGTAYTIASTSVGGSGSQQKGISTKIGKGFCGNEGTYNGGYNLRRWNTATDTQNTTCSKPIGNSGEENLDMGQAYQYMMGMYDGAQNNRGWKFNYNTETGYELGAGSVRTGVPGGSSGHCVWKG